ncbi:MAG TPA: AMP-binding protein [Syntrophorhabdaceae bacterium]|nr:AMP-binding protein [Syntrophorhabdaceae bacterium]HOS05390.1 AMP-binding protein [Syntrophorhabdaceae bacterium]
MIKITPLDEWIKEKIQFCCNSTHSDFTNALEAYQLRKINETIDHARSNSPFYRRMLRNIPMEPFVALSDFAKIPFTTPSDIAGDPFGFLAVRQNAVSNIVTLRTSGSTGNAKRIFFTNDDLELTIDFFHRGMRTLVSPGQKVAILLPGAMPDSVGDLLMRGLSRLDVQSLVYGPVIDPRDAVDAISSFDAHCLVGIPIQVLDLAHSWVAADIKQSSIENVLLSTDYVPRAISRTLQNLWGCRVFNHYGMTEMGLGGGVECEALDGYHLREADLYLEIVDHETGRLCPDGVTGEVVFTTLTRKGMPLIRYRTGDMARIIPEPCPCGSALKRMECVKGRWSGIIYLEPDSRLFLSDLDEALFGLSGLLDYRAIVSMRKGRIAQIHIDIYQAEGAALKKQDILHALNRINAIQKSISSNALMEPTITFSSEGRWSTTGTTKRKIVISTEAK